MLSESVTGCARNAHKVREELASLRKEVEETAAVPAVVMTPGYDDDAAGPPVALCRLPGLVTMADPRDALGSNTGLPSWRRSL